MAPLCRCGHRASDHNKQMNMRTWCTADSPEDGAVLCPCTIYRPKETK